MTRTFLLTLAISFAAAAQFSTVKLKDGQSLRGRVVSRDEKTLVVEMQGGVRVTVPVAQLAEVIDDSPEGMPGYSTDSNRTRYLYSPSGFMLHAGESYFSQTELMLTTVAFGLTDNISIAIGSVIPALFADRGANFVGAVKVGGSLSDYVHVAGGVQAFFVPAAGTNGASAGFLFGTLTLGTPDAHVGVSVGPPFTLDGNSQLGAVIFSVSGNLRVADSFALVTENWFFPGAQGTDINMVNAFAGRIIGDHIGVDLGLVRIPTATVPAPWLDFTYNFH